MDIVCIEFEVKAKGMESTEKKKTEEKNEDVSILSLEFSAVLIIHGAKEKKRKGAVRGILRKQCCISYSWRGIKQIEKPPHSLNIPW